MDNINLERLYALQRQKDPVWGISRERQDPTGSMYHESPELAGAGPMKCRKQGNNVLNWFHYY